MYTIETNNYVRGRGILHKIRYCTNGSVNAGFTLQKGSHLLYWIEETIYGSLGRLEYNLSSPHRE